MLKVFPFSQFFACQRAIPLNDSVTCKNELEEQQDKFVKH